MGTPGSILNRIMVVEDEPSICEICQHVLTGAGFEVDIAENGKVAQAMIVEKRYDMCLIDIRMPEVNGKELYQWLQEKYPQMANKVMFTTRAMMIAHIRQLSSSE